MLFLGYLIFLVFWPLLRLLAWPHIIWNMPVLLSSVLIYIVGFIFSFVVLFFLRSYQSDWLIYIKRAAKIKGIRWLIFLGFAAALGMTIIALTTGAYSNFVTGIAFPYAIVSFLNLLGVEYYPAAIEKSIRRTSTIELPVVPDIEETTRKSADFIKTYKWEYNGLEYEINIVLRKELYYEKKSKARLPFNLEHWANEYVVNGICPEIRELTYKLTKMKQPTNSFAEVSFVLNFVQSAISYAKDMVDGKPGEYPKYPIETLVEEAGDCEDVSFLGAAILKSMGYEVALFSLPGHIALGIAGAKDFPGEFVSFDEKSYYYVEMTADGWAIGEMPDDFDDKSIEIYPIPSLVVS